MRFLCVKVAEKVGQLDNARMYIEEIDGLNKIDKLQENDNEDVYKSAYHIIDRYFNYDVILLLYLYNFNISRKTWSLFKLYNLFKDDDEIALQPQVTGDEYNFTAPEIASAAGGASVKDNGAAPKFNF